MRRKLTSREQIEFLDLVAQMSSSFTFERKLDISAADIDFYKKEMGVETPQEARRLHKKLKNDLLSARDAMYAEEAQKARQAQEVAQARLEELEARRNIPKNHTPLDANQVRKEDAERQRRFEEQQSKVVVPEKEWKLPMVQGRGPASDQIDAFRREIVYHGLSFVRKKYNASAQQIRYEADRLGLNINWDVVRR